MSGLPLVERGEGPHGSLVRTTRPVRAGEKLFDIDGEIVAQPSRYSIQMDANRHILPEWRLWGLLNHGCAPNTHVDIDDRRVLAIVDIPARTELRFNYATTEWKIASPFQCRCASAGCVGLVRGFAYLDLAHREAIRPWLSALLRARFHHFD